MTSRNLCHPIEWFLPRLMAGDKLCLLPISRLSVDAVVPLSDCVVIYPPGALRPSDLNLVWWPVLGYEEILRRNKIDQEQVTLCGDDLHWFKVAATGIDRDTLFQSTLIAVTVPMNWDEFLIPPSHEVHLEQLRMAITIAEGHMDLVRFHYCNPMVQQTFPNAAGYHLESNFTAGLFYNLDDNESYVIAGEVISSVLVQGLGLELDETAGVENVGDGEVGRIAKHALRLYSDALSAPNETLKFIQLMNLIEYLASPFEYMPMKDVKKNIARHVANDRSAYEAILEDFKLITSEPGSAKGPNRGLRHNIIHMGCTIEQLLGPSERRDVLNRMIRYAYGPILDLIRLSSQDWSAVEEMRLQKAQGLGV